MRGSIKALRRGRAFTLLELLLVFALLAAVGGVVTLQYRRAEAHARFQSELGELKALFRSVDEALWVGFDPLVTFTKEEGSFQVSLQESSGAFPKKGLSFSSFSQISFEGREPPFSLRFAAKGMSYPEGILLIEGEGQEWIDFSSPFEKILGSEEVERRYPNLVKERLKK